MESIVTDGPDLDMGRIGSLARSSARLWKPGRDRPAESAMKGGLRNAQEAALIDA
jgi:hypothetical protein